MATYQRRYLYSASRRKAGRIRPSVASVALDKAPSTGAGRITVSKPSAMATTHGSGCEARMARVRTNKGCTASWEDLTRLVQLLKCYWSERHPYRQAEWAQSLPADHRHVNERSKSSSTRSSSENSNSTVSGTPRCLTPTVCASSQTARATDPLLS